MLSDDELQTSLRIIAGLRKEGDGMMKLHRESVAREKWADALSRVHALTSRLSDEHSPKYRAEILGVRAGLLKRLGDDRSALDSYHQGAQIEAQASLGSTYNRMNEIRTALLLDATTIKQAKPQLIGIFDVLEKRLNDPTDTEASSDGWLWADLGDVCTLLSKASEAEKYYRAFVQIAGGNEARITRETLELLLRQRTAANDPDANQISAGLEALARATRPAR